MRLRLGPAASGGDSVFVLDEATRLWVSLVDAIAMDTEATPKTNIEWVHDAAALRSIVAFLGLNAQGRQDARDVARESAATLGVPLTEFSEERLPLNAVSLRDAALYVQHMAQATKGFVGIALQCGHVAQLLLGQVLGKNLRLPRALGPCTAPSYYVGNPQTIVPSHSEVRWPSYCNLLDYELEVAFLSGTNLPVDADEATCAVGIEKHGGFVMINDFSARDVQLDELTSIGFGFVKCKSFCTAMGSEVVTCDELWQIGEKGKLFEGEGLKCEVFIDGERWSSGTTSGERFCGLAQYVQHVARGEGLVPGEVLGLGTVPNCCGLELPGTRFLAPGQTVEIRCEGFTSVVSNTVGPGAPPGATNFRDLGRDASSQPSRFTTSFKFLVMALVAPFIVFFTMICGSVAALVWPGPPSFSSSSSRVPSSKKKEA